MTESTNQKSGITDRPAQAMKDFAQQGVDYSKDLAENSEAVQQSYSTAASGAVEFNAQWIEMVRENTNTSFDFARRLLEVKSPSDFFQLSTAHTRKQMESFAQQAQHLAGLAQKATTDAVKPIQAGMKSALDKAG